MSQNEKEIQNSYIEKVLHLNELRGAMPYCAVQTYGCQQNASDSEKLKGQAEKMGYIITDKTEIADLIIFNTCAVRDSAEKKVFGNIGAIKHLKQNNRSVTMVLCGCMTAQEHIPKMIKEKYPHIDIVFGTQALYKFPSLLYENLSTKTKVFSIQDIDEVIPEGIPVKRESSCKAYVTIMYGCNNFCSYCIVPYVRGRERSRQSFEIEKEVKELINEGYKDITLLGQNVNSYGKDLNIETDFADLLKQLNNLDGDFILRFMTSHPKDITKKLIDTISECKKVCKHIHLPVQAGSNRILKLMNRGYTREKYLELIDYAKSKIKDLVLTSDIIAGFPTETSEDFLETIDLIKKAQFDCLFTFIYSKRKGTPADTMEGQIPYEEKHKNFVLLTNEQKIIAKKINDNYLGKTVRVLVEGESQSNEEMLTGRTEGNKIVNFAGDKKLIGQFADILITDCKTWHLTGVRNETVILNRVKNLFI